MLKQTRTCHTKFKTSEKRHTSSSETKGLPDSAQNQTLARGSIRLWRYPRTVAFSKDAKQLFKFLIIGCTNFAISFVVFYLCYKRLPLATSLLARSGTLGEKIQPLLAAAGIASPDAALANILGYSLGTVNSFVWNRTWTFKNRSNTSKRFRRFVALNILCLLLSSVSMMIFVDLLHWPYGIVWVATMGFITILNFIGNKFWVFKEKTETIVIITEFQEILNAR
jgi:putative flippase GtrA